MFFTARSNRRRGSGRNGLAVVEFAVCLPVITLLIFAAIEACSMMYLKQSLAIAAYEAGRTAIVPGATSAEVIADCQGVLTDRKVTGAQITLNPTDITTVPEGSQIEISVSAPCDQNRIGGAWFFGGSTLTGRAEFMKEY